MKKTKMIKELAEELLSKMEQPVEISIEETGEGEEATVKVKIKTEEPGVLIGFHGKTLSAVQTLLGMMVFRKLGQWQSIVVDVNDYRVEQEERLRQIALNAAQRARFSGRAITLSPMTPFERRIIHLTLGEVDDVESESSGEGDQRRIVVTPKQVD